MNSIAILLRSMQLYAHAAHNLIYGETFFSEHEFLGELYPMYEADYDSVVERMIGLGEPVAITVIHIAAAQMLSQDFKQEANCVFYFQKLNMYETQLCSLIESLIATKSEGTKQLLGEICNKSEMRQYKLKQRLKNMLG